MDDFFAPPPFKPADALQRLHRDLKALGLTERAGVYERRGTPWVKATAADTVIEAALAKAPARSPQWQTRALKDSAQVRDFLAAVKQQLAKHEDRDE